MILDTACGILKDAIISRMKYTFCANWKSAKLWLPSVVESGLLYSIPMILEISAATIRKEAFFTSVLSFFFPILLSLT